MLVGSGKAYLNEGIAGEQVQDRDAIFDLWLSDVGGSRSHDLVDDRSSRFGVFGGRVAIGEMEAGPSRQPISAA